MSSRNKGLLKAVYYAATLGCLTLSAWALWRAYASIELRLRYWACLGLFVVGYVLVTAVISFLLKGRKRYLFHTIALQLIPLCASMLTLWFIEGRGARHRVVVSGKANVYERTFNDLQKRQKSAALKNGVKPFESRADFERKREKLCGAKKLVKISTNSKYIVRSLSHSVPYVVPKVAELLDDIATKFQSETDSDVRFEVTSVLRTVEDVAKLQKGNANASSNSCHCNATTIDISYETMGEANSKRRLALAKTISKLRDEGRCYVKFERNQHCYHITVR